MFQSFFSPIQLEEVMVICIGLGTLLPVTSVLRCKTCQPIIERIKQKIPQFCTQALRKVVFEKYGLITPSVNKAVLRHLYEDLVGNNLAADTASQEEVDARVSVFFDLEEPYLVFNL